MNLPELCIKRPVLTTMLVLLPVVVGILAYARMGVDLYPNVDLPIVIVTTTRSGASVEEMETGVTKRIEEAVNTISGIDELRSTTKEGLSTVVIQFLLEKNRDVAQQEVQGKINTILSQLPTGTDTPIIDKFDIDATPVMTIAISGKRSLREVTEIADKEIKDSLSSLPGVGSVSLVGGRKRAINVTVDTDKLDAYGLAIEDVRRALGNQNLELPGGRVDQQRRELVLRTMGRIERTEQFAELIVANLAGNPVRLKDLGRVEDAFEEPRGLGRLDGDNAVLLVVQKQSGTNTVQVIETVKTRVAALEAIFAAQGKTDLRLQVIRDQSVFVNGSLHEIHKHLLLGALLVAADDPALPARLAHDADRLALDPDLAHRDLHGHELVRLHAQQHHHAGAGALGRHRDRRCGGGAREHLPLDGGEGPLRLGCGPGRHEGDHAGGRGHDALAGGDLPADRLHERARGTLLRLLRRHHGGGDPDVDAGLLHAHADARLALPQALEEGARSAGARRQPPLGRDVRALRRAALPGHPAPVDAAPLGGRAGQRAGRGQHLPRAAGLAGPLAHDRPGLHPQGRPSEFEIAITTPEGWTLQRSSEVFAHIEDKLRALPEVVHVMTTIGDTTGKVSKGQGDVTQGSIYVRLVELTERAQSKAGKFGQFEVMGRVRQLLATDPLLVDLRTSVQLPAAISSGSVNADLEFTLIGPDLAALTRYSDGIIQHMRATPGFADIDTTTALRKPELRVEVDRDRAMDQQVSIQAIAATLGTLVGGQIVSDYKDDQLGELYDVWLRAEGVDRGDRAAVERLKITSTRGTRLELGNVAHLTEARGPSQIDRFARQRKVTLIGNLAGSTTNRGVEEFTKAAAEQHMPPEYQLIASGRAKTQAESNSAFVVALILSLVFMYMILASQFESFVHPITILLAVPLTIPFALLSLILLGQSLTIFSILGVFLLFGIVKKNGILQVDYTNVLLARAAADPAEVPAAYREGTSTPGEGRFGSWMRGQPADKRVRLWAILEANRVRLRPILMTTMMLIASMVPIALGQGPGAASRASMAKVIVGGQALSLLLSLLVTPVAYSLFADASRRFRRRRPERG